MEQVDMRKDQTLNEHEKSLVESRDLTVKELIEDNKKYPQAI